MRIYWRLYGGWKKFFSSPYLYIAVFLTGLFHPLWLEVVDNERVWTSLPVSIIPSMLGFSMGGMAIMLAFSGARYFEIVSQKGNKHSLFVRVIANFFHFILFQTIAIISAIFASSNPSVIISAIAFWSFCYAILVGVATAGQLLRVAQVMNAAASLPEKNSDEKSD